MGKLCVLDQKGSANQSCCSSYPNLSHERLQVPSYLHHSIQATINLFWWGHRQEDRKIHWLGSSKLCVGEEDRSLGFRDMATFNDALLAKQFWRITKNGSMPLASLFRVKYFLDSDIFGA